MQGIVPRNPISAAERAEIAAMEAEAEAFQGLARAAIPLSGKLRSGAMLCAAIAEAEEAGCLEACLPIFANIITLRAQRLLAQAKGAGSC